jgi:hypothetical protein
VEYKVHETLPCEASEFFSSASKEEWKEGQEHQIPLPDDTPSVVDLYVQWVYTGRIIRHETEADEEENQEGARIGVSLTY